MKGQFSESLGSVGFYARKNYAHKGLHYAKPGGFEVPVTIPSSLGEIEVGIVYLWCSGRAIALQEGRQSLRFAATRNAGYTKSPRWELKNG